MSFKVSNSFNLNETLRVTTIPELFQKPNTKKLKPALKYPPIPIGFKVLLVSLLIHSKYETEKLFGAAGGACIYIGIITQDYTAQHAACSMQFSEILPDGTRHYFKINELLQ
jgi:hypothetical protein